MDRSRTSPALAVALIAAALLGGCLPVPGVGRGLWRFGLGPDFAAAVGGGSTTGTQASPGGPGLPETPPPAGPGGESPGPSPTPRHGSGSGGSGGGPSPLPVPTETPTDDPLAGEPAEPTQPPDCSPCDDAPRAGVVLAAEAPFGPLAGVVATAGGATTMSAADGSFALPAPSGSAELVTLALAGRATSVVAGWRGGALSAHLAAGVSEPAAGAPNGPAPGGLTSFEVTGRVVDGTGAGVVGARVAVGSPAGATGAAVSGVDGAYTVQVLGAPAGGAIDATVWAWRTDAGGEATAFGSVTANLTPGAAGPDLALAASVGQVALAAPLAAAFAADFSWELVARGQGGVALTLARRPGTGLQAPVFAGTAEGCEVRAAAAGHDGATAAFWRGAAAAGATVAPAFLRPPVPSAPLVLAAGATWAWRPVAEAGGYRVEVRGADQVQRWEAFTALPRLTLPAGVPGAPGRVRIVATTEGGLRELASVDGRAAPSAAAPRVGPAAPQALRLFEAPTRYASWEGTL